MNGSSLRIVERDNLMTKKHIAYSFLLESWENEAYEGKYGSEWLEEVGEGVRTYAKNCEINGKRPTFRGLIQYLQALREL